jgi:hypothetical protein
MKTIFKLIAITLLVAVEPLFAIGAPPHPAPDGGATALLMAMSVGGLVVAKNFLKPRR